MTLSFERGGTVTVADAVALRELEVVLDVPAVTEVLNVFPSLKTPSIEPLR